MSRLGFAFLLLLCVGLSSCDSGKQLVTHEPSEETRESTRIVLSDFLLPSEKLLPEGEDPAQALERVMLELETEYPELEEQGVLPSIRGEVPWVVLAISSEYADAAPLLARAFQLRNLLDATHQELRRESQH